jgi:hypothetical protein
MLQPLWFSKGLELKLSFLALRAFCGWQTAFPLPLAFMFENSRQRSGGTSIFLRSIYMASGRKRHTWERLLEYLDHAAKAALKVCILYNKSAYPDISIPSCSPQYS